MTRLKMTLFAIAAMLCFQFSSPLPAQETEKGEAVAAGQEGPDISGMIFGHILDSYEWHFTDIGDTKIVLYLPCIVKSETTGWHVFSSSHLYHPEGAVYEGFQIAESGSNEGKIIEVATGERPLDISITKNALALLINSLILICIFLYCARWYKGKTAQDAAPKGFVGAIESMVGWVYDDIIVANIPQHANRYAPYLLTAFFFIFLNNLIGLIPGSANITGNIAITFFLATCTFLMINLFGNKHYWLDIFNPHVPWWLKPIMIPIEILGMFTKPVALMIRLFANIMAGHTAMLALFSMIFITASMGAVLNSSMTVLAVLFTIFMNALELLVAFIQAYVFTMLSAIFIGLSQPVVHESEA